MVALLFKPALLDWCSHQVTTWVILWFLRVEPNRDALHGLCLSSRLQFLNSTPAILFSSSSFPFPSCSVLPCLHISALSAGQHTGPAGADHRWPARTLPRVKNGTDDACLASAVQWDRKRAEKEMDIVRGLLSCRPRGECWRRAVWCVPVLALLLRFCAAFNLDEQERVVFSGQRGSYFGYSVEFFNNSSR